jgi:membrane fusion protein, multidrug efflux system
MPHRSILKRNLVKAITRPTLSLLVVALLALAGCNSSSSTDADGGGGGGGGGKGKGKGKGGAAGAVPVVVATAEKKDVPIELAAVGVVEAYTTISVKSQVSGQLTDFYFTEGDYVHKGDKLFSIDARPYEAQLAQADANVKKDVAQIRQAEANLSRDSSNQKYAHDTAERFGKLGADGIVSKDQIQQLSSQSDALAQGVDADKAAIESAKAQMLADEAQVENIKVQLSYCTMYAQVDGRTGNVSVKKGNIVAPNTVEVLTINQVEPIYVTFSVPEARLPEIRRYMAQGTLMVTTKPQDGNDTGQQGKLTFIDNQVDTTTGTIKIKGLFPNTDRKLWPGQFLNVTLRLTTQPNSVIVPNQAVQNGQDGQFIYVVKPDQTVEARTVTTGPRVDQDLVILTGIEAGETVVTDGQLRLQPGSAVTTGSGRGGGGGGRKGGGRKGPSS